MTNLYKDLTDASIPETRESLEKELNKLETERGNELTGRYCYLADISAILASEDSITLGDLRNLEANEIHELTTVANNDLGINIWELTDLLGNARRELKNIILFKVLKISKDDLTGGSDEDADYAI